MDISIQDMTEWSLPSFIQRMSNQTEDQSWWDNIVIYYAAGLPLAIIRCLEFAVKETIELSADTMGRGCKAIDFFQIKNMYIQPTGDVSYERLH